jgi:hypothetical protein
VLAGSEVVALGLALLAEVSPAEDSPARVWLPAGRLACSPEAGVELLLPALNLVWHPDSLPASLVEALLIGDSRVQAWLPVVQRVCLPGVEWLVVPVQGVLRALPGGQAVEGDSLWVDSGDGVGRLLPALLIEDSRAQAWLQAVRQAGSSAAGVERAVALARVALRAGPGALVVRRAVGY